MSRSASGCICALMVVAVLLSGMPAVAGDTAMSPHPRCEALAGLKIPASVISLPTNGGRVGSASAVTELVSGESVTYCRVDAAIFPIDPSAPDIKLRVAMPFGWNGRAMMFGGGGFNGTIPDVKANVPFGRADRPAPLARRYAIFASDSGHQADPVRSPITSLDGSFAVNDESLRNFSAGDALKKALDSALFLLWHGYGTKPDHTYFAGGSTGGREALAFAQRWPHSFDGIISVYPAWNNLAEVLYLGYATQILARPGAFPGTEKQTLLYDSVIRVCDDLDGLADKVISNVRGCDFDPRVLRCPNGLDAGPTCLSDRQITSVIAISSLWKWRYDVASGERGYPGFPFLSGADMRTPLLGFGATAPANPMPKTSGYGMQYWDQWVKYFLTRDPDHDPLAVDPIRPGAWLDRISYLSTIQDLNDSALRPFARSGGKLLLLHGAADELVSHRSTSDYYRRVRGELGPKKTREFMRYYLVPGANHANITPAFAAGWDSIAAIEQWVEKGKPPTKPVVIDGNNGRSRPLCEYPLWPKYRWGDPASAASFVCAR